LKRMFDMMNRLGVEKALKREKIKEGDIIEIAGRKFQYLG